MPGLQVLTVTVAPALFWAVYHYHRDRHQPEPMLILFLTYGLGIVAGYLGVYAYEGLDWLGLRANAYELALSDRTALFFYCVLVIGVVEEGVKLIPFLLVWVRLKHFDERIDGIYLRFVYRARFCELRKFSLHGPVDTWRGTSTRYRLADGAYPVRVDLGTSARAGGRKPHRALAGCVDRPCYRGRGPRCL